MVGLFEFGLLAKLKGLYRNDFARHMNFDGNEENEIDAMILTHTHVDRAAYIHYIRSDIPIYFSEATKLITQAMQDTEFLEELLGIEQFKTMFIKQKGSN